MGAAQQKSKLSHGGSLWNISNSVATGNAGSVTDLQGVDIRDDGKYLWACSRDQGRVFEYQMMTAWDITTLSSTGTEFNFSEDLPDKFPQSVAHGIRVYIDRMYLFNRAEILEFSLGKEWDITSATHIGTKILASHVTLGHDFDFSADGTMLFIDDRSPGSVHRYDLSTAWDITTATHIQQMDISEHGNEGWQGMEIGPDGHLLWICERKTDELHQWVMNDAYDLTTAFHDTSINMPNDGTWSAIRWNPDGDEYFVSQYTTNEIHHIAIEDPVAARIPAGMVARVTIEIVNEGSVRGNQDITLKRNDTIVDNKKNVTIAESRSSEVVLQWNTNNTDIGKHTLTVETDDDSNSVDVAVISQ